MHFVFQKVIVNRSSNIDYYVPVAMLVLEETYS